MRVYADNAATTKLSPAAKEAMLPYFDEIYGNPSTLYTLGQEAAEHLLACRTEIAQLIGAADPREIVFTSGGSEADNQAIISAARNGARKGKKHLISTKFEHHAVLHTLDKLRKEGFDVTLLDVHENGVVRVEDVAAAIREDTALVSVMFANNEIGTIQPIQAIGALCRERGIPIRIGVNGGSLDKRLLEKYGHPTAEALVESAFEHLELLEKQGFYDTCVSMKSSTVPTMVAAARLFRAKCDYPLHIGVTETGPVRQGLIKSAMGIGALLLDGIGDTIRVSLTDDPVQEVYAARDILKAAGLRRDGVNIVSCPTCGRTRIDLIGLVNRVDEALKNCEKPITVAVMGCVVNGPGEAREADIGIAGGDGWGMIFEKGVQVEKLPYDELLPALLKRIEAL